MSQTFPYTAEEIESRLRLIDENKNLLPYPYTYTKPLQSSLEDVGDGSFLTTGDATTADDIFLNDCILSAGDYTPSLKVTGIIDSSETTPNPGFRLKIRIGDEDKFTEFKLEAEKTAKVYLEVPGGEDTKNLLIKPQIEKGTKNTTWVPYMGTIGSYVDERFNSTNIKLRDVLAFIDLVEVVEIQD
jgi:hypothetical protein